jgi:TonB-linked SusC/RagA family outer membrane protein
VGNRSLLSSIKNIDPSFNIVENIDLGSDPNRLPNITMRGSSNLDVSVNDLRSDSRTNPNLPLFILDGFEVSLSRVNDLDQNIVESITLLKDASATAMYGSRGANGVVVIVSRNPEVGQLRVTYKGDLSIEAPDLTSYNLMNSREKLAFEKAAGLYSYGRADHEQLLLELYNSRLKNVERGVDTYWLKYPVRTGVGQKHSLRVEGGSEEFQYAANVGYNNIEGAMKGSARNTFNGDIYLIYKHKNVTFKDNLSVSFNNSKNSPYGSFSAYTLANSYYKPYDDEGNLLKLLEDAQYYPMFSGTPAQSHTFYNPLWNASQPSLDESRYTQVNNNFELAWDILPHELTFRSSFGFTRIHDRYDRYVSAEHTDFINYTGDNYGRRGRYTLGTGEGNQYEARLSLDYNKVFNDVHQIFAGANISFGEEKSESLTVVGEGISNTRNIFLGMAALYEQGSHPTASESISRRTGATFNANYTYNRRYFLDISGKVDGSSVYGSDNRMAPFGSVGIGWNAHHETFLANVNFVDEARLRLSYGTNGSQNYSPYQALMTFNDYGNFTYNGWSGMYLLGLGNKELGWQTTYNTNFGVDLAVLKQRVRLTVDIYNKLSKDVISDITLPSAAGFDTYKANIGELTNKGYEISLRGFVIRNPKTWSWYVGGTLAHNKNTLTKISNSLKFLNETLLAQNQLNPSFQYKEGESINTIFAVKSHGIDPSNGNEIFQKLDGSLTYTWNGKDEVPCGVTDPKFFGNINTTIAYKNLSLTAVFSYRNGGSYYNQTLASKLENILPYDNADKRAYYDRWKTPGENALYKSVLNRSATQATSRFVMEDNSIHFSNISAQYELESDWLKKHLSISYLSLSGYLEDIFTFSTIKQERGLSYPYSRKFSVALTARF